MSDQLTERPNLDHLKRQAKRLLRDARSREPGALTLLRTLSEYTHSADDEMADAATLNQVQLGLARDYGYASWAELKTFVESQTPRLGQIRLVFKIGCYEQALAHYRDWLDFGLDWDWFEAAG